MSEILAISIIEAKKEACPVDKPLKDNINEEVEELLVAVGSLEPT